MNISFKYAAQLAYAGYQGYSDQVDGWQLGLPNNPNIESTFDDGDGDGNGFRGGGTGAYARVYSNENTVVVTFSGTNSGNDVRDWPTFGYYQQAAMRNWTDRIVHQAMADGKNIVFTGDSLGGLLAQREQRLYGGDSIAFNSSGLLQSDIDKLNQQSTDWVNAGGAFYEGGSRIYVNADGQILENLGSYTGSVYTVPTQVGYQLQSLYEDMKTYGYDDVRMGQILELQVRAHREGMAEVVNYINIFGEPILGKLDLSWYKEHGYPGEGGGTEQDSANVPLLIVKGQVANGKYHDAAGIVAAMKLDGNPNAQKAVDTFFGMDRDKYSFNQSNLNTLGNIRSVQGVAHEYLLAPDDPTFIDATLSFQDMANGYFLEDNEHGVRWRITASGRVHPDDLDKYQKQCEYYERLHSDTILRALPSEEAFKRKEYESSGYVPIANLPNTIKTENSGTDFENFVATLGKIKNTRNNVFENFSGFGADGLNGAGLEKMGGSILGEEATKVAQGLSKADLFMDVINTRGFEELFKSMQVRNDE